MRRMKWEMGAAVVMMGWALAGCGGPLEYAIHGSPKAPEIDARIVADVKRDSAFTSFKISIEHLAPPDRLGDGKKFVVWTKSEKATWQRVGALQYDDGARKAAIEGASAPVTAFDLQVTVEKETSPQAPSSDVVLAQHVN